MDFFNLQPDEWQALTLTLRVAAAALLVTLPLAILVAYILARYRFPGHGFVNALVHLPLVLPPVVTGYVLLLTFGRKGPIGVFLDNLFGISFAFNWTGAALAASVMSFPLIVRPIRLSFEAVDPKLEDAARSLGAHRFVGFLTVTLPLALPGILGGAILGFAKAMGEFGATITFVSNIPGETRTLALALYTATQTPSGDLAAFRLTLIAVVVAFAALIASELLARRLQTRLGGGNA
ncbi:MAG: molybdate ABC transporter permease subunit [Roseibium album]|uniref:molybdate ABC transporter permease subunit n=1 Tax=Roseibium album TaxID=311410 RepID=UPI000CF165D7|nr:molybdate ABC transporter permease subunit [Roseibium album]MBG6145450.1 molybdate transport system permease protein [Labrenzia sp. EL_142]MBG6174319.1 molybdate transport system permease protein [Labrenzia sp. EL_132]MBG6201177.1 molybdate transport system permease protein [Labrenzia sp. EL_13]MBG6229399.1 molybdate transport system permease protein [Labrenzia sp. EL_208]MCR9060509.1 molybdate ABC transporter permease subunit [Paracoccaceae bacterium]